MSDFVTHLPEAGEHAEACDLNAGLYAEHDPRCLYTYRFTGECLCGAIEYLIAQGCTCGELDGRNEG